MKKNIHSKSGFTPLEAEYSATCREDEYGLVLANTGFNVPCKLLTGFTPTSKFFGVSSQNERGFTLIELLLYLGLSAVLILATSVFLSMLLESRIKNQAIGEVEQQGLQVMQSMTQIIRNAEDIDSPDQGTSASSLSLITSVPANNPIIFDLSSGVIRITEGVGGATALTNSRITASDITFKNLSRPNTPGIIRVQFTLTYKNPNNVSEYNFQKTFITSGALR